MKEVTSTNFFQRIFMNYIVIEWRLGIVLFDIKMESQEQIIQKKYLYKSEKTITLIIKEYFRVLSDQPTTMSSE